jgi:Ulp1 family protease
LSLLIIIGLIVAIGVLIIYLTYATKAIAEEASKKSLASYESKLSEKLQTQIGLFFRDENVRNNLLTHIGTKSIDKKIECWQTIQKMYFKFQKSWSFSDSTDLKEFVEIDSELNDTRTQIFTETIHIGYFLAQKMIHLNSLMRENIRLRRTEFSYSGQNYQSFNDIKLQNTLNRLRENEQTISELMYEIEKWIIEKLHSDQTIENFEFSREQLDQIKKEREMKFETISE